MANRSKEQVQKEYDDIVIKLESLNDALEQAKAANRWYADSANGATRAEQKKAEAAERRAAMELQIYRDIAAARKEILKKEGAKTEGSNGGERTKEDIEAEKNKEGFNMSNFKGNLRQKGGGSMALGAASVVTDLIGTGTDIYVSEQKKSLNTWMANQDAFLKTLETGSKLFQRHMKTFSKGMQGALSSSFASITQGVQEGAYAAAASSVDFASESLINMFSDRLDLLQLKNFKELNQKKAEFENLKETANEVNGVAGAIGGVASLFGPIGSAIGGLITGIAQSTTKILVANAEIDIMRLQKKIELEEKKLEALNEAKTTAVEAAKDATTKILDFSKSIENLSIKTDEAAKSMANIIGMSGGNVAMFEKYIFNAARNLKFTDSSGKTTYLNKSSQDMLKVQSQYIEESTRNNTMSQQDFVKTFQLGEVLGGDSNLAATLLGDMDYFNKSIETGTDLIYDMFKEANKAGVSNRKFAKDLQQNLKLAQKYTFKGGVEGMMKMSIWAQKTRFNMQNLENMVDSIQDGGLEGVITKGAQLQVLGGNMAMGADPLAMMYESWADPEALAKRFSDMTKGVGYFNSKTGEVDITGPDAMRLKEYAKAAGIDYKDARAQVTQRIKGEQIDKQLTKNYSDEQKALIYNKAKRDKNGQWVVTLDNGETKNVNDLNGTDWNSLMPTEESIEDYVAKIYSLLNQEGGVTLHGQAIMSDETFDNLKENINERMQENLNWVYQSTDILKDMIGKSNDFVTAQNKQQHEVMLATSNILDEEFEVIQKSTEKLKNSFEKGGSNLRLALDAVKNELDYELALIRNGGNENAEEVVKAKEKLASSNNELYKGVLGEASEAQTGFQISERDFNNAQKIYDWFLDESNASNINSVMSRLIGKYESDGGKVNITDYESILSEGYDDLMDALEAAGLGNDDIGSWEGQGPQLIQALIKYAAENRSDWDKNLNEGLKERLQNAAENIIIEGRPNSNTNNTNQQQTQIHPQTTTQPLDYSSTREAALEFSGTGLMDDGIISNNNKPIISQVEGNFTRIQDGIVKGGNVTNIHNGIAKTTYGGSVTTNGGSTNSNVTNIHDGIAKTTYGSSTNNINGNSNVTDIHDGIAKTTYGGSVTTNGGSTNSNVTNIEDGIASGGSSITNLNDSITNIRDGIVNTRNNKTTQTKNVTNIHDGIAKKTYGSSISNINGNSNVTNIEDGIASESKSMNYITNIHDGLVKGGNVTSNFTTNGGSTVSNSNIKKSVIGIHDGIVNEPKTTPITTIHDGFVKTENNSSMVMPAGKITPINDGLVKSDPKDVAIFAKEGGVIGNFLADLKSDVDSVLRGGGSTQSNTMKIEISGSLELSSGGQSINIIEEFNRNPILLRSFTRMLAQQIASNKNGGRQNSEINNFA